MDLRFDGKTAIVTGGASGIGAAVVDDLAASGATVIIADLDPGAIEAKVAEVEKAGGRALGVTVDVSKPDQVKAMVDFAVDKTGRLDHLVNNAGIGGKQPRVAEASPEAWQKVLDVNLNGVFYGMRHAIPEMLKTGGGAIVNIASILGVVGAPDSASYVASKHAVIGLTRSAALEYSAQGIRINSVGPGFIKTPLLDASLDEASKQAYDQAHPIGRMGEASEVAAMVVFLLSDRAGFITGSNHLVDGGYTAK